MKKTFFGFALTALALTGITSCGDKTDSFCGKKDDFSGSFKGTHTLAALPAVTIPDTLTLTPITTNDSVNVFSYAMNTSFKGGVSSSACGKAQLQSIVIDSIMLNPATNIYAKNVRGTGTATLTENTSGSLKLTTSITFSGGTAYNVPIAGTLNLGGQAINGVFTK